MPDDPRASAGDLARLQAQIESLTSLVGQIVVSRPPAAPPMGKLLDAWADAHRRLVSFACDYSRARRMFAWAPKDGPFAGVPVADRDPMTLTAIDADLWKAHRYGMTTRLNKPPSPALLNRELMMLLRVLNFAASRQTIVRNPLVGLDLFEEENNAREVVIDEAGFAAIVDQLYEPVMVAYVTLAFDSGMRRTETHLCRWAWIDERRWTITVPGSVAKNGRQRVTDMSERAFEACRRLPRNLHTDEIFVNQTTSELFHPRWLYELFERAVEESGVRGPLGEKPVFHDLRRSWITLARRRGVSESEIMAKSGHQDHAVFRRYSIVGEEDLRRSREKMEAGRALELAELQQGSRIGPQRANICFPKGKRKFVDG